LKARWIATATGLALASLLLIALRSRTGPSRLLPAPRAAAPVIRSPDVQPVAPVTLPVDSRGGAAVVPVRLEKGGAEPAGSSITDSSPPSAVTNRARTTASKSISVRKKRVEASAPPREPEPRPDVSPATHDRTGETVPQTGSKRRLIEDL
jgi:hypothetical protein